jgi:choline-sulfatase
MSRNLLIIMVDEMSRDGIGCYDGVGITPNLDRLAGRGTRFTNAYIPSPICCPARAAFQSGRHVFQTRCWSNAQAYSGTPEEWAHRLKAGGHHTVSIGKLHYRGAEDDNGYVEELNPLYIKDGKGWVQGLLQRSDVTKNETSSYAGDVGVGEESYSGFDVAVRDQTVTWLKTEGRQSRGKPRALFTSFLRPHYPPTCPKPFLDIYDPDRLPPIRYQDAQRVVPPLVGPLSRIRETRAKN